MLAAAWRMPSDAMTKLGIGLRESNESIASSGLYPGDYNHAEPGTADTRVWSENGCTCLLITSPSDTLN
jgi:hypothetical protein